MTAEVRAINCTSCGAGQDILGGGRVQTFVCSYCGSALDAQDDFKVIKEHQTLDRPASGLALGDKGDINGVAFTVIGSVGWEETYGHQRWLWVDHQIYSPTHGYAWITRENDGNYSYTRKRRQQPHFWLTPGLVENAESRPVVWLQNQRYRYYETSSAQITFLEGAFNWQPELGQSRTVVSLMGEAELLSLSQSEHEREVEITRLLTEQELASFDLPAKPANPHAPLATPARWGHFGFALTTMLLAAVLAAFGVAVFSNSEGRYLNKVQNVSLTELPVELPVDIPDSANLLWVGIDTGIRNAWIYVDLDLEPVADGVAQASGAEISYYTGRDSDGSWKEGSQFLSRTFTVAQPGPHVLTVSEAETGGAVNQKNMSEQKLSVVVRAKKSSGRPLMAVAGIFLLISGLIAAKEAFRKSRLLRGSDWTTED